jgi:hypothetical protein
MEDISQIRKKIAQLNKARWELIEEQMRAGKLLKASFYERLKKCNSPNCKCASGELHGPFPWIYQNRKGLKLVSTSCVQDKVADAKKFTENYKTFKTVLQQIVKIDKDIQECILRIGELQEVDVEQFIKKDGEKRGRKSSNSSNSIGK